MIPECTAREKTQVLPGLPLPLPPKNPKSVFWAMEGLQVVKGCECWPMTPSTDTDGTSVMNNVQETMGQAPNQGQLRWAAATLNLDIPPLPAATSQSPDSKPIQAQLRSLVKQFP